MDPAVNYATAWADYWRFRRAWSIAYFGGFAVFAGAFFVFNAIKAPIWAYLIAMAAWTAVAFVPDRRLARFPCPRCGEAFLSRKVVGFIRKRNMLSDRCLHCGLRAGALPSEASETPIA